MKNKLKALVAGTLGVCAMAMVGVSKVNAASYDIGTSTVTTITKAGDTKTWDFKVDSSKTLADGDDVNGVIVYGGYNKGKAATPSIKSSNVGIDFFLHGYVLVPVVSASSSGKIQVILTSNSGGRYLDLIDNTGAVSASMITSKTPSTMNYTFDADDVWTIDSNYYVKLWSEVYTPDGVASGDTHSSNSGEIKMGSVSITLDNESYGAAATLYDVKYMDGTNELKTDSIASGESITYSPKKYGYDFDGWYTDAELNNKIDSSYTVTESVTLYAKWTAWTETGIEEYTLSNAAIGKIATGIDGSLTADLALTPSIYTYMKGGTMTTTGVTLPNEKDAKQSPCFNTNAAVSTTGNGIKFTAPFNGTLTTYIGVGGGSSRNAKLTDGTNDVIPTQGAAALAFDYDTVGYAPIELTFEVTKGTTYYLGGDNGMRIYYLNLEADPSATFLAQYDNDTTPTKIRFVAMIDNVVDSSAVASVKFTLNYNGTDCEFSCKNLYSSVTNLGSYTDAENRYYAVYTLTGTNIKNAITAGKVLSSLKVTVTFTDGSSVEANHTDITLGSTLA